MTPSILEEMRTLKYEGEDRFFRFWFSYKNCNPEAHQKSLRRVYLYVIIVSTLSSLFFSFSFYSKYSKNINQKIEIVRIDGVVVEEFHDLRRDVLIQNIKQRALIKANERPNDAVQKKK